MKETGRYRFNGEPTNGACAKCMKPIWRRNGIHTMHHGHEYWANSFKVEKPESIVVMKDNAISIVCPDCFGWEKEKQPLNNRVVGGLKFLLDQVL